MISSLASKCQDFKVEMPFFQPLYVMKLKTSKFKVLAFCCHWRYYYQIQITRSLYHKIKNWHASGSSIPPSFIPALQNIGILCYKLIKLCKHLQYTVYVHTRIDFLLHILTVCPSWWHPRNDCVGTLTFWHSMDHRLQPPLSPKKSIAKQWHRESSNSTVLGAQKKPY